MLRFELLPFLAPTDLVKLALVCKDTQELVDPNQKFI